MLEQTLKKSFRPSLIVLLLPGLLIAAGQKITDQEKYCFAEEAVQFAAGDSDNSFHTESLRFPAKFFPIFPWDAQHGFARPFVAKRKCGLESIAECNFTIAGFVRPEDLPSCEKLHLTAIMIGREGFIRPAQWSRFSEEQIDRTIRQMVNEAGDNEAVIGYFITDEPGASDFDALAKAVKAVRKYAPGKLAYINLFPNYATIGAEDESQLETDSYTEYLERFVREVKPQVISYDNYMVQYSQDMDDAATSSLYYTNLLEVRRVAQKYDLPFWNIVSSNQIRPSSSIPSPSNLLFQAYTTLAAGGSSVSWYTYYPGNYRYGPVDTSGRKTLTWRYLQEVNRQLTVLGLVMNQMRSTGVYFTSPPPVKSLPVLPGKVVQKAISDTPLMIGEFEDRAGGHYAMVVNLSLKRTTKFTIETEKGSRNFSYVSAEDGTLRPLHNREGHWLIAGQGLLVKPAD